MALVEYDIEQLRDRGSVKWTRFPDTLGAFIAEADFGTAPAVHAALAELVRKELFTYTPASMEAELTRATADFHRRHYGWDFAPSQVRAVADVCNALLLTIDYFTAPGAPVVVPTPAYMPFLSAPGMRGREVREVALVEEEDGWRFDFEALEAALEPGALLIVCNPHNPLGKVYTREEMERISEIVERTGARVFNDEIHAPLVFAPAVHVPYATVNEAAARHAVTATAASKAFNIPGLKCAQFVFTNPADLEVFDAGCVFQSHAAANPGFVATTAAYDEGEEWLAELVEYFDANRTHLAELVAEHLPRARYTVPDGTYIGWLDLRAYDLDDAAVHLRENAGVALTDGRDCGAAGEGFVRLNFATPRPVLREMIERLGRVLENHG